MNSWMRTMIVNWILLLQMNAAPFITPSEICPPFRRDALPIHVDAIRNLAGHLSQLSQTAQLKSPEGRRAAAQALALAQVLDPDNKKVSQTLSDTSKGKLQVPPTEDVIKSKAYVWKLREWLSSEVADKNAIILADLLTDIASHFDPEHSMARLNKQSKQHGYWKSWVASINEFREPTPVPNLENQIAKTAELPQTKKEDNVKIILENASIKTVLKSPDAITSGGEYGIYWLDLVAQTAPTQDLSQSGLGIYFYTEEKHISDAPLFISNPIFKALKSAAISLPDKGSLSFNIRDQKFYSFEKNTNALSGPGFVLSYAALKGQTGDAIAIGKIDHLGELITPTDIWQQIQFLRNAEGGILVVPASAEPYFLALLTFENPEFFLKYSVYTASSPKEFAKLCAAETSETQASAVKIFKEIRDNVPSTNIGSFISNSYTRARLLAIQEKMPNHLSAKMLALQGSIEKPPRTLNKVVLASLLSQAIDPFKEHIHISIYSETKELERTLENLDTAHAAARLILDDVETKTEPADLYLHKQALELCAELKRLARAAKKVDYLKTPEIQLLLDQNYTALTTELNRITKSPGLGNELKSLLDQREIYASP